MSEISGMSLMVSDVREVLSDCDVLHDLMSVTSVTVKSLMAMSLAAMRTLTYVYSNLKVKLSFRRQKSAQNTLDICLKSCGNNVNVAWKIRALVPCACLCCSPQRE
jgi:hypothetical protein